MYPPPYRLRMVHDVIFPNKGQYRGRRALPLYDVMSTQQFAGDKERHIQKCGLTPLINAMRGGERKHKHGVDKLCLLFQLICVTHLHHFLLIADIMTAVWLHADCCHVACISVLFCTMAVFRDWKCSPSLCKHWLYPLCPWLLAPLIDRPRQFISHCDGFLRSQGRQGKRRGMQIKCSETLCTIPIVF